MNRLFKTADPLDAFTDRTVLSRKKGSCPLEETLGVAESAEVCDESATAGGHRLVWTAGNDQTDLLKCRLDRRIWYDATLDQELPAAAASGLDPLFVQP